MKKYLKTFVLFGSLAFLIMWVDQVLYKGVSFKDSYFFLMFALAGFLIYTYMRGKDKMEEQENDEKPQKRDKIKPSIGSKKKLN